MVSGVFGETDYYLKSDDGARIVVSRFGTSLELRDVSVNVGDYVVLEAFVTGVAGYPVNGTVTVVGQRNNYTISVVDGYGGSSSCW